MNWKTEAMEKLRTYETMQAALKNLPREISRLEEEYKAIGSQIFSGKSAGRNLRSREDGMINNIVRRQELQWSLDQAQQWMQTVSTALDVLEPEEVGILQQLYICPKSDGIERLCEKLHLERSSIYRKRDSALRKFTLALYGATESN